MCSGTRFNLTLRGSDNSEIITKWKMLVIFQQMLIIFQAMLIIFQNMLIIFSGNVDHFSGDVDHFSGNADHFSADVDHFSSNVDHFSADADHFSKDVDHFSEYVHHAVSTLPFRSGGTLQKPPMRSRQTMDFCKFSQHARSLLGFQRFSSKMSRSMLEALLVFKHFQAKRADPCSKPSWFLTIFKRIKQIDARSLRGFQTFSRKISESMLEALLISSIFKRTWPSPLFAGGSGNRHGGFLHEPTSAQSRPYTGCNDRLKRFRKIRFKH